VALLCALMLCSATAENARKDMLKKLHAANILKLWTATFSIGQTNLEYNGICHFNVSLCFDYYCISFHFQLTPFFPS
jgi:hypothetical protein